MTPAHQWVGGPLQWNSRGWEALWGQCPERWGSKMIGHHFREENEIVRHLCCLHGRKRWEKLLGLAAPSLPRTHHLYRSGALSYEVGQVPLEACSPVRKAWRGKERKGNKEMP